jgi:hypothetical protein
MNPLLDDLLRTKKRFVPRAQTLFEARGRQKSADGKFRARLEVEMAEIRKIIAWTKDQARSLEANPTARHSSAGTGSLSPANADAVELLGFDLTDPWVT